MNQQGYGNPGQGKPNQGAMHPAQAYNSGGGQGKQYVWSFLCCCGRQSLPAAPFLVKTFMIHMIINIVVAVLQLASFYNAPKVNGNDKKETAAGQIIINMIVGLLLAGLNFLAMQHAKKGQYSCVLNVTTIINCVLDILAAIGMFIVGAFFFIISAFMSGLKSDSWTDEQKSAVKTFTLVMYIFTFVFFLLGAIYVSLISQACSSCDAAKELEHNRA